MNVLTKILLAASLMLSSVANANAQAAPSSADAPSAMSTGEVKRVDKTAGKVTIKHGPLDNLNMGAMTMVFRAADPAMLEQVSVGDKVRFVAEQPNGQLTVTKLEKQP